MPLEGVHIIEATRLNVMQAVCDTARIWNRSRGEDRMRAEQALIRALTAWEALQRAADDAAGRTADSP